ncbi:MAG: radical SAM protein, partial [Candidatus Rokuibacteriota bacterium]
MTMKQAQSMKPGVASPGMAERLGVTIDERRGVEYHELRSKDLLNKFNGRPMPFGWTVNPYRGCEMACRYCFARYTHEFLGLDDRSAFERRIYVKSADRDRLVAELRRARRSGQSVAIGTATDPSQPAEGRFEVTRRVLEAARSVPGLHLSITTKSTLVARDAGLLREISAASDVTVNLSITTVDAPLARRLEPRAPRPDLRLAAMKSLADAGVAVRLFMMPILPRLTDDEANVRSLLVAARDAGAV